MVTLFRTMPGIPGDLITIWDGLERKYEEKRRFRVFIPLDPGESGRAVATTALRVVHAVQVFQVGGWYWCNDQEHGSATTWRGLGPAWEHVYSDFAFVEARALSQMFPPDRGTMRGRVPMYSDPCVNLENKEIVRLNQVGNPEVAEAAISRSEL